MSLTTDERRMVEQQILGVSCQHCGGPLVAADDGITSARFNVWGVGGAYVFCEDCGAEYEPTTRTG